MLVVEKNYVYELNCFRVTSFLLSLPLRSVKHYLSPKLLTLTQNTLWQICLQITLVVTGYLLTEHKCFRNRSSGFEEKENYNETLPAVIQLLK